MYGHASRYQKTIHLGLFIFVEASISKAVRHKEDSKAAFWPNALCEYFMVESLPYIIDQITCQDAELWWY